MSLNIKPELQKLSVDVLALLQGSSKDTFHVESVEIPTLGSAQDIKNNVARGKDFLDSQLSLYIRLTVGLLIVTVAAAFSLIYFAFVVPASASTAIPVVTTLLTGGLTVKFYSTYTKWANDAEQLKVLQTKLQHALEACEQKPSAEIEPCKSRVVDLYNQQLFRPN